MLGYQLCEDAEESTPERWYRKPDEDVGDAVAMLLSSSFLVKPLKKFELFTSTIGWLSKESFLGKSSQCEQTLAALEELNLSLTSDPYELDYPHMPQLQTLLKQVPNLSTLTLLMDALDDRV